MAKILAFSGSARRDSLNQKLVTVAAEGAREAGAEVTLVNLGDFEMPLFNQDLESEQGMPDKAREFKQLMIEHDGLLIASPEYNSAFSPLLKNAIDWASRSESDNEPSLAAYRGKTAAIMSTSPGGLGGLRGLVFLRMLLGNLGVVVLPDQQAVPNGFDVFDAEGRIKDQPQARRIHALGGMLAEHLDKISGGQS